MILSSAMLSLISIPSYNSGFLSWIALLPQLWTSFATFNVNSSFNKISIDTRKVSPNINSFSVSGNAMSASHFDIDCLLTLHIVASSSCVIPFVFLSSIIFSDNFTVTPPTFTDCIIQNNTTVYHQH